MPTTFHQNQIHDNPYQTRIIAPASVDDLVQSIKDFGLQNPPTARPHPTQPGHVQLIEGHRRRAAWFMATIDEPLPIEVRPATDREMFELNVIENSQRADLNDIEKARQMLAYIDTFKVSQAEAGKLFNIATQGAVSNLLRLLDLPPQLQTMIILGRLSQRTARALIVPARIDAPYIVDLVQKQIADALEDEDPEAVDWAEVGKTIEYQLQQWVWKVGQRIDRAYWDLKAKPVITVDGESAPRPCDGCPLRMKTQYNEMCMSKKCFNAKVHWYSKTSLAAASKKLGIPVEGANEKAVLVWDGGYPEDKALALVKSKPAHLRLGIRSDGGYLNTSRQEVLGSPYAGLFSVDPEWIAKQKAKDATKNNRSADTEKQKASQAKYEAEFDHCQQVITTVLPLFAASLPYMPAAFETEVAQIIFDHAEWQYQYSNINADREMKLAVPARRARMMECLLAGKLLEDFTDTAAFEKGMADMARAYKVKLPKGWNVIAAPAPAAKATKAGKKK